MKATLWVVRNTRTGDYVGPNRKMVTGLLGAGVWEEDRARAIADVDRKCRRPIRLVDALRSDPSFATGSVADLLAQMIDDPEISEERPDGYLFRGDHGGPVLVLDVDGNRIGEVHSFGHTETLDAHPAALAHARWRVAGGSGMGDRSEV